MAGHLTKPTNRIGWISDFNGLVYCTRKIGLVSTMAPLFFAPTGAQEMLISVRSCSSSLSKAVILHLS